MSKKLYAGNLSYNTTEQELHALFAEVGTVTSVAIIMDRETGRSKGFGFVEMADDSGAQAAVQQFDGTQLDGRTIKVAEARPRERTFPARPGDPAGRNDTAGRDTRSTYYRSDDRSNRPPAPQSDGGARPAPTREASPPPRQDEYAPRPSYNRGEEPGRYAAQRDDRGPRGGGSRDGGDKDATTRDEDRGNRRGSRTGERRNRMAPSFEDEWYGDKNMTSRNDRRNRDRHTRDDDEMSDGVSRRRKF